MRLNFLLAVNQQYVFSSAFWRAADLLIDMALAEDLGEAGDVTTLAIAGRSDETSHAEAHAEIIAKSAGVVAGTEIVRRVFQKAQPAIAVEVFARDGESLAPKTVFARLHGQASGILSYERTALNFLQRLSGIATLTRKFVDAVAGTQARLLDTRKTTPGWRWLEKYAVRCGGGTNHRFGLHDMFLIKENHIAAAGDIPAAVQKCRMYAREQKCHLKIEVETKNLREVEECLHLGVDRIMLDNMPLQEMRGAVALVARKIPLEASGNVTIETVRAIAETGVDFISIGALTHSAPAMDFSLLLIS
ncbi:MAG: carboxylating nicotinate-nucleotide diphosphorylase [bacterium]